MLIQKIQLLQKRLIVQAQNTIKNATQLQESERLYKNLRELISRQPGPDIIIRLQKTQQALKKRGTKMKVRYIFVFFSFTPLCHELFIV